jgi:hypothetical protein
VDRSLSRPKGVQNSKGEKTKILNGPCHGPTQSQMWIRIQCHYIYMILLLDLEDGNGKWKTVSPIYNSTGMAVLPQMDETVCFLESSYSTFLSAYTWAKPSDPWRWRHVPLKHHWPLTILHCVKTQKTSSDQHLPRKPANLNRKGLELVDIHCSTAHVKMLQFLLMYFNAQSKSYSGTSVHKMYQLDTSINEDITCFLNE